MTAITFVAIITALTLGFAVQQTQLRRGAASAVTGLSATEPLSTANDGDGERRH
jgi:hypothetical protein